MSAQGLLRALVCLCRACRCVGCGAVRYLCVCLASDFMMSALMCSSTPSLTLPSREGCRWMGRVQRLSTNSPRLMATAGAGEKRTKRRTHHGPNRNQARCATRQGGGPVVGSAVCLSVCAAALTQCVRAPSERAVWLRARSPARCCSHHCARLYPLPPPLCPSHRPSKRAAKGDADAGDPPRAQQRAETPPAPVFLAASDNTQLLNQGVGRTTRKRLQLQCPSSWLESRMEHCSRCTVLRGLALCRALCLLSLEPFIWMSRSANAALLTRWISVALIALAAAATAPLTTHSPTAHADCIGAVLPICASVCRRHIT